MKRFWIACLGVLPCLASPVAAQETLQEYFRKTEPFAGLKKENRLQIQPIRGDLSGKDLAAFILRDTIQIYFLEQICTLSLCGGCGFTQNLVGKIALPIPSDSAQPVMGMGYSDGAAVPSGNWVGLVLAYPNQVAYRWSLSWNGGGTGKSLQCDTLDLLNSLEPLFVIPGPITQGFRELPFTLLGTRGGTCWIDRQGLVHNGPSGWNSGFISFGQNWLGRNDGRICQINYTTSGIPNSVQEVARPFQTAVDAVDSSGAVSSAGHLAVRQPSGSWRDFSIPPGDYAGFRVVRDDRGLGVDLYGKDSSGTHYQLLANQPTLFTLQPSNLDSAHRKTYPYLGADSLKVLIAMNDPEGNFGSVRLRILHAKDSTLLISGLTAPSAANECPGHCPTGNPPSLTLRLAPDSLSFDLPILSGSWINQPGCNSLIFSSKTEVLRQTLAWSPGDSLELVSDGDRFVVVNALATGIRRPGAGSKLLEKSAGEETVDALGRTLRFQAAPTGSAKTSRRHSD